MTQRVLLFLFCLFGFFAGLVCVINGFRHGKFLFQKVMNLFSHTQSIPISALNGTFQWENLFLMKKSTSKIFIN